MKTLLWKRLKQQVMLLTIVLLLSNVQLYAQTWFPLAPNGRFYLYSCRRKKRSYFNLCSRDTIIQGKAAVILNGSSDCSACNDNTFYYDSSLNIVYQYLGSFKPYFDSSKQPVNLYHVFLSHIESFGYDSVSLTRLIVNHQISGINVRFQYISISEMHIILFGALL